MEPIKIMAYLLDDKRPFMKYDSYACPRIGEAIDTNSGHYRVLDVWHDVLPLPGIQSIVSLKVYKDNKPC